MGSDRASPGLGGRYAWPVRTGGTGANPSRRAAAEPAPPRPDTRRFKPELTPTWLHLATLLAGHEPPPPPGSRADESPGPTPVATGGYRVAHPDTDVWWWDPTLAGAEAAGALRDAAALPNLTVHQDPEVHVGLGGGPRDLVVIDGVVDAVDTHQRAAVLAAATAALRPGGLLCVAYRTEVGWTEVAPVHHLLRHLLTRDPRPVEQAVPDALAAVDALHAGGAQYLVERPVVQAWWQDLRARPVAEVLEALGPGPLRPTSTTCRRRACPPDWPPWSTTRRRRWSTRRSPTWRCAAPTAPTCSGSARTPCRAGTATAASTPSPSPASAEWTPPTPRCAAWWPPPPAGP